MGNARAGSISAAARKRSNRPLGDVEHDRCRSLVKESLDELGERVRIFKACSRVEAGNLEEFPVALHAPIYPPCPHLLALSPATNFYSGHSGPSFTSAVSSRYWHAPSRGVSALPRRRDVKLNSPATEKRNGKTREERSVEAHSVDSLASARPRPPLTRVSGLRFVLAAGGHYGASGGPARN